MSIFNRIPFRLNLKTNRDFNKFIHYLYNNDELNIGWKYKWVIAYKFVESSRRSVLFFNGNTSSLRPEPIIYTDNVIVSIKNFSTDPLLACGEGINVATLKWVNNHIYSTSQVRIALLFQIFDIVSIPFSNDTKFRVQTAQVLGEVDKKGRLIKSL